MMQYLKQAWQWLAAHCGKRTLIMAVATTVALTGAASGTLAWLIDQTPEVVNTFTYGDINITLTETDSQLDQDGDATTNEYRMVPGASIDKDPQITVAADSEDCWLFVELKESNQFDTFLTYETAEGWTALAGQAGVYYRQVDRANVAQVFPVLKDDRISVLTSVTKDMLNQLDANNAYPQLTITAYAIQRDETISGIDDVNTAWSFIQGQNE